ncbi:uncharacterized protein L969DRAFT_74093 [Mixia osmundae IAM 14324]|uniref:Major facilitator superfamily (MFS) profile domain-containing protein n=1 Tax=Mixia osmundae (strain CBS 9802 / IAM 14324 / JCM 22182 / KY 12970) TaxID=764103 RepID=G7E899_MIXOS|nr:uncharacterized protein L969DRAFT_74093 [Mixia osmundae IAM 14324]KEI39162.1 hypothetical protein L969DRAFT_74093 [Mixia osmundae IAM 14324]GAA99059.1 hypothetical protein E5Q_05748 [Mixia osmundae IAM 14324]
MSYGATSPAKTELNQAEVPAIPPYKRWLFARQAKRSPPRCLEFRASVPFVGFAVFFGLLTDLAIYGLVVPIVPFRLRDLGYEDVASLTGWLVAAYAGGMIISSPPVAYVGELTPSRQWPLICSLGFMACSLVLFMLARSYWLLVLARVLQGCSGSGLWILSLPLIIDTCPEAKLGTTLGYVMLGLTVGSVIGPVLGGVLYTNLGYYAPFIFAIILVLIDLTLRCALIEKRDANRWRLYIDAHRGELEVGGTPTHDNSAEGLEKGDATLPTIVSVSPGKAALGLLTSKRAMTLVAVTVWLGILTGGLFDAAQTLLLNHRYGLNSQGAGLVFIAVIAPGLVTGPLSGVLTDRYGPRWPLILGYLGAVPWIAVLAVHTISLATFIIMLVLAGAGLGLGVSPLSLDFGLCVLDIPGAGYAHVYGLFNIAFALGTLIGPILAGQLLQHLQIELGFDAMVIITCGLFCLLLPCAYLYIGTGNTKSSNAR